MKKPQRDYVVEFKAGRRRSETRVTSIWGNTDLQALARAAKEDAPHLFDAPTAVAIGVQPIATELGAAMPPVLAPETSFKGVQPVDEPLIALKQPAAPADGCGAASSAAALPKQRGSYQRGGKAPRKPSGRSPGRMITERPNVGSSAFDVEVSIEELDALTAENLRLKTLLAKQLLIGPDHTTDERGEVAKEHKV
ncbi:hypothetical protein [Rhizobium sp. SL42]|uniref:hypothetical protein n=1 Tax=Rhizobium sp. SL42 TaxID=2806346 RepID=UPI001F19E213|nr:hypothetical protein [Rhizobium sp. SL42]UJW77759.1 hypothetical protein IM739_22885 [Rhizobium sp. SL42]